jgi:cell wall-associated NlpC family hydrolase
MPPRKASTRKRKQTAKAADAQAGQAKRQAAQVRGAGNQGATAPATSAPPTDDYADMAFAALSRAAAALEDQGAVDAAYSAGDNGAICDALRVLLREAATAATDRFTTMQFAELSREAAGLEDAAAVDAAYAATDSEAICDALRALLRTAVRAGAARRPRCGRDDPQVLPLPDNRAPRCQHGTHDPLHVSRGFVGDGGRNGISVGDGHR